MKIFISTITLFLIFWNINVESPKNKIYQSTNTGLEYNRNEDFNGLWVNEDDQTRGITKCNISYKNNRFVVQMWGSCQPQDCDMGERVSSELEKGIDKFDIIWSSDFSESTVTYEIIDGKLKLTNKRHYKDNSGRSDFTLIEYFIKQ